VSGRDVPVLIVDDNAVNRRILEATLRRWLMKPEPPSRVSLLDAQMPDMDGCSVAEEMKKDPELVAASVVMMTSGGRQGDGARCLALKTWPICRHVYRCGDGVLSVVCKCVGTRSWVARTRWRIASRCHPRPSHSQAVARDGRRFAVGLSEQPPEGTAHRACPESD
jgi:CheY-like chemotaxis protein